MNKQILLEKNSILDFSFLLCAVLFFLLTFTSYGKTHIIQASNYEFDPANDTVAVGDTIVWQWVEGKHTTTSSKIPDGAATWDAVLKSSTPTFTYVVTVPGEYDYVCTPHADMGMVGTLYVLPSKDNSIKEHGMNNGSLEHEYNSYERNLGLDRSHMNWFCYDAIMEVKFLID